MWSGYQFLLEGEEMRGVVKYFRLSEKLRQRDNDMKWLQHVFEKMNATMDQLVPKYLEDYLSESRDEPKNTLWKLRPHEKLNGNTYLHINLANPGVVSQILESVSAVGEFEEAGQDLSLLQIFAKHVLQDKIN